MSPILDVEMVREIIDPPAPRLTNVTIADSGNVTVVGLTYDGYLVGTLNDGRQTNYSTIRGTLSRFPERRKTW